MRTVNERALSVALVQSEREVLHTPGLDLSAFLTSDPRWDVQLFSDRNFEGLAETASQFDCIVFGFNVLYLSEALRTMLQAKPPQTGMVILHQLSSEALAFLPEELRVGVVEVDARRDRVLTPLHRHPRDEILLSWPDEVAVEDFAGETGLAGSAICYLENGRPERWRTVFDIEHEGRRLPVAARTLRSAQQRAVLCNLWVEPTRPSHAALLGNMIRYAAMGFPEVAVLGRGGDGMDLLAQKIRVQGTKVVELRPEDEPDPFSSWPLKEVGRAVVGRDDEVPESWRERGGTVVRVGDGEEVSITGGAPDAAWVAQQWAVWFNAVDAATWHGGVDKNGKKHKGSTFQSRAILRMLAWIEGARRTRHLAVDAPPPSNYARELGVMMALRIDEDGSLEGTVSSTAAARDINLLTGGRALTKGSAEKLDSWLAGALQDAAEMSVADRLDIARTLADATAVRTIVEDVRARATGNGNALPGTRAVEAGVALSPMVASALRHACVAAFDEGSPEVATMLDGLVEETVAGLSANLLLAADYLHGAAVFSARFPGAPLTLRQDDCAANLVQSISAVGNYGYLVRLGEMLSKDPAEWQPKLNGEVVSTEALALIEYLGMQPSEGAAIANTHVIAARDRGLPPLAVNHLIREVQSTRAELTKARADQAILTKARHVFGTLILLVTAFSLYRAVRPAFGGEGLGLDLAWLVVPAGVLGFLWFLAHSQGLAPKWLDRAGKAAFAWIPGIGQSVLGIFKKDDDAAPGKEEAAQDG